MPANTDQVPVVAVASGKGGVGKTTLAVNVALALGAHELERGPAVVLGGIENMAGQVCPSCGELTPLFTPAPADEAIWTRVPRLASVPFSALAAQDADRGQPVMVTRSVPGQVAAYQLVACGIRDALRSGISRPDMN